MNLAFSSKTEALTSMEVNNRKYNWIKFIRKEHLILHQHLVGRLIFSSFFGQVMKILLNYQKMCHPSIQEVYTRDKNNQTHKLQASIHLV